MFAATDLQRPVRHTYRRAQIRHVDGTIAACSHRRMETPHNECMLALRDGVLFVFCRSETGDQRLDKFVLQSTRSFGVGDDLRGLLGKSTAAACSRSSRAIIAGGGVSVTTSTGGLKSHPAVAAPMAASASTGSDIVPHDTVPDERV